MLQFIYRTSKSTHGMVKSQINGIAQYYAWGFPYISAFLWRAYALSRIVR